MLIAAHKCFFADQDRVARHQLALLLLDVVMLIAPSRRLNQPLLAKPLAFGTKA